LHIDDIRQSELLESMVRLHLHNFTIISGIRGFLWGIFPVELEEKNGRVEAPPAASWASMRFYLSGSIFHSISNRNGPSFDSFAY